MSFSYEDFDKSNFEQLEKTYQHLKNGQPVYIDSIDEDGCAFQIFGSFGGLILLLQNLAELTGSFGGYSVWTN